MRQTSNSPSYLIQNPYSYCFRMIVPIDIRNQVGKTELRFSLRTTSLRAAKLKSSLLSGLIWHLFTQIRHFKGTAMELTKQDIAAEIDRFKQMTEKIIIQPSKEMMKTPSDIIEVYGSLSAYVRRTKNDLNVGSSRWVDDIISSYKQELTDKIGADTQQWRDLIRSFMLSFIDDIQEFRTEIMQKYPELDLVRVYNHHGILTQRIQENITQSQKSEKRISEVIQPFIIETEINWTEKTKAEVLASLNLFLECVGDVPIQSVTRAKVAEYKNILLKLPPNKNKSPDYRDKTITEIMDMDVKKTLSVERVNKNLQRAGQLFDYAIRHGIYDGPNPATKMQLPKDKWAIERRAPYTNEELERLLISDEYRKDEFDKSFKFWSPIIALFHGMRQKDIAGLFLEDIKKSEDGIWYFDLFSRKANPKTARRVAPIHPFILDDLNFISYVERLKEGGKNRLFPELKKGRDGYGKKVSKWFNEKYKGDCGIESPDERLRDFHSFRTTFITRLRYKKVHLRMLKEVVGHSVLLDVTDIYTDPYPLEDLLNEVILKANFHEQIDLSHLKNSKWVVK